ncbi:MAG TPA: hypothetical protein VK447_12545 [Myxococcaceae bacterium]|nr:hypothetical protein [Myxococcaceae bacterium]
MKITTAVLVLLMPLGLGCTKAGENAPPAGAPPAEKIHGASPVDAPPPGARPVAPPGTPAPSQGTPAPTPGAPTYGKATPPPPGTATPPPGQGGSRAAAEACVDKYLAERKLNEYGDAEGTMYAGGSPLFDERTGTRTERLDYIFAKHPQIKQACSP